MKKKICICIAMVLLLGCMPICAADALGMIVFADERETPSVTGGYPRFEQLADGTLILVSGGGTLRRSNDNGKTWKSYSIAYNAAKKVVSSTGTEHVLSLENWQPYVAADGTVFVAYRARTKDYVKKSGAEFYTSIRVMKSTNNGYTFANEEVLVESITDNFNGYWEPILMQIDENTIALYYADDLNVDKVGPQQNINYVTYDIPSGTWDKTVHTAINGVSRNSRDGMPGITRLCDGGFAMVVEAHDYAKRIFDRKYYVCPFVIGLSLSKDGKNWNSPVPVAAPDNLTAGYSCAAPFIATLPDGRVVITYQTDENYVGERLDTDTSRTTFGAIVSDAPLTVDTVLTPSTGGAAEGFSKLDVFTPAAKEYTLWNSVYCAGDQLYFAGGFGSNGGGSSSLRIRRAAVYTTVLTMTVGKTAYTVNGETKTMDAAPLIRGDRTMLPVRYVAEALGASVAWDADTSTATVMSDTVEIRITVGSGTALVNGESVPLDAPAFVEKDRAYMPVRFIAETLGAAVSWDGTTSTATIRK